MKLFWVACWLSFVERSIAAVLTPHPATDTLIRLYAFSGGASTQTDDDVAVVLLFHGQCLWSLVPNHSSDRNDTAMLWNNSTVEEDSIQACCNASVVTISNILQHNVQNDDTDEDDAMRIVLRSVSLDPIEQIRMVCLQSIARIVSSALLLLNRNDDNDDDDDNGSGLDQHHMLPTLYSFVYSKTITHPTRTLPTSSSSSSSSSSYLSSIRPPPPYHLTLVTQKQYQFHLHHPELFRLVTDDDIAVRMESTTPQGDRYSFSIFHPCNTTNTKHPPKAYPWRIQLWTNLSETGGMHRDMYHTIQFQPPPPSSSLPFPSYIHNNISLYMLLHIPSDLYLNVEDCFRWEKKQDRFTSHRADGTKHSSSGSGSSSSHIQIVDITVVPNSIPHYVIDQEEPAFVSPSHAILVHVQLLYTVHQDHLPPTVVTVEFATKLHVRYPPTWAPSPPRNVFDPHYHRQHNFRSVIIPPPILVSGTIVLMSVDDDDVDDTNHDRSRPMPIPPRRIPYDPLVLPAKAVVAPQLLQLWVAPGHQSHFLYVVWVTITVAMIGSIRMLQDISFVSVWG
jgi:hypothetical protein